jgi:hypothetical protein
MPENPRYDNAQEDLGDIDLNEFEASDSGYESVPSTSGNFRKITTGVVVAAVAVIGAHELLDSSGSKKNSSGDQNTTVAFVPIKVPSHTRPFPAVSPQRTVPEYTQSSNNTPDVKNEPPAEQVLVVRAHKDPENSSITIVPVHQRDIAESTGQQVDAQTGASHEELALANTETPQPQDQQQSEPPENTTQVEQQTTAHGNEDSKPDPPTDKNPDPEDTGGTPADNVPNPTLAKPKPTPTPESSSTPVPVAGKPAKTPTPTATPKPTLTPTSTPVPRPSLTPTATSEATPTPTPTPAPTPVPIPLTLEAQNYSENLKAGESPDFEDNPNIHFAEWAGIWKMPNGAIVVGYYESSGRIKGRSMMSPSDIEKFGLTEDKSRVGKPSPRGGTLKYFRPEYDFYGTNQDIKYAILLPDGTLKPIRVDADKELATTSETQQPTIALHNGQVLRRVNGDDRWNEANTPHTAFLQRIDNLQSGNWGPPESLQANLPESIKKVQISRMFYTTDGKHIIALGQAWENTDSGRATHLLMLIGDDEGRNWQSALTVAPGISMGPEGRDIMPNEWDAAELANGDLVAMMRDQQSGGAAENRAAILKKDGDVHWTMNERPYNPGFIAGGHPELLSVREGAVLYIGVAGVYWSATGEEGSWQPLKFNGGSGNITKYYYPNGLQENNGVVDVDGHVKWDASYTHPNTGHDAPVGESQTVAVARFVLKATYKPGTEPIFTPFDGTLTPVSLN